MLVVAGTGFVQAMIGVPPLLRVKIVLAAVAFDRAIDKRFGDTVEVAVIGNNQKAALEKVLEEATKKKIRGKAVKLVNASMDTLGDGGVDVAFFTEPLGARAAKVVAACNKAQMTCVAAGEADVAAGLPVGVEISGGKPKLLINIAAAKACGANFSAQILKLARLVK